MNASGTQVLLLLYRISGSLISTALVLLFIGTLFPRYLKKRRWWLRTHRGIGIGGAALGIAGIGIAACMISQTAGIHLPMLHSVTGLLTLLLLIFTPVQGYLMLRIRKGRARAKTARALHRWLGRFTLLALAAVIVLGLPQSGIL